MPTLTALMVELTKDMSYEELVQIKEEAEEEARLEIERIENMSAGEAEQELARFERKLERKESER
jgi:hypothetical protein